MAYDPELKYDPDKDYQADIDAAKASGAPQSEITKLEDERAEKVGDANSTQLADWGINEAGQRLSSDAAQAPNGPPSLTSAEMKCLEAGNNKNDVTIDDGDGNTKKETCYILNGHSYVANSDGSGQRLLSYSSDDTGGKYSYDQIKGVQWTENNHGQYQGSSVITLNGEKKQVSYDYPSYPESIPYINFNEAVPTLTDSLKTISKFSYFFGVDSLSVQSAEINTTCCFISKEINVGTFSENDYIQLEAAYNAEGFASIEFYILDGNKQIPILPVGDAQVYYEKIFYGMKTRFPIDTTKPITIKKDNIQVDVSIDKAILSTDGLYTIDYAPVNAYNYKPLSTTVKIKAILRLYNRSSTPPSISKIKIRKYGGNTLWQQTDI